MCSGPSMAMVVDHIHWGECGWGEGCNERGRAVCAKESTRFLEWIGELMQRSEFVSVENRTD